MRKFKNWFKGISLTAKITGIAVATLLSVGVVGAAAQQGMSANVSQPSTEASTSKVETKTVSTTEPIPFTSSTVEDNTLDQGVTQTRTKGVNGVITHTYTVSYLNGVETGRSKSADTITTPAVNEVIVKGTKAPVSVDQSCPSGTYVNSVGTTICSPYSSSTTPSGASAQCVDGTYSFSQHRSGTCSHHGGVAVWY